MREAINQRNRRKKFGQVSGQALANEVPGANAESASRLMGKDLAWWTL